MRLLLALGYARVRHYRGGLAEWREMGFPLERENVGDGRQGRPRASEAGRGNHPQRLLDLLSGLSFGSLLWLWLSMVVGWGLVYWLVAVAGGDALRAGGSPVSGSLDGLLTALYFSAITATSVGYGDVAPVGWIRTLAVVEAAAGLLLFGILVSKLVSRHQEELTEEIHRTTFETRLGRVRTNLHLVLTELQGLARMCADPSVAETSVLARVESAARVFVGELQAVHDLLYRPQQVPEEQVLEGILSSVAAGFEELHRLLGCLEGHAALADRLRASFAALGTIAREICADCVPHSYAPGLRELMDRVQGLARELAVA